jgi:CHASE1-domain containing sensor protein
VPHVQDAILGRIDAIITLLRGGAELFAASRQVEPNEFRAYIERVGLRTRYRGIQGIGFTRRIAADERDVLVEAARAAGATQFRIWPEHARPEDHTILYLEPLDERNKAAIGYCL